MKTAATTANFRRSNPLRSTCYGGRWSGVRVLSGRAIAPLVHAVGALEHLHGPRPGHRDRHEFTLGGRLHAPASSAASVHALWEIAFDDRGPGPVGLGFS